MSAGTDNIFRWIIETSEKSWRFKKVRSTIGHFKVCSAVVIFFFDNFKNLLRFLQQYSEFFEILFTAVKYSRGPLTPLRVILVQKMVIKYLQKGSATGGGKILVHDNCRCYLSSLPKSLLVLHSKACIQELWNPRSSAVFTWVAMWNIAQIIKQSLLFRRFPEVQNG